MSFYFVYDYSCCWHLRLFPAQQPRSPVRARPAPLADRGRSRSPAVRRPEYAVRVPLYPFATPVRDYSEVARRYTHLFIAPDFAKVVFRWPEVRRSDAVNGCCQWKICDSFLVTSRAPRRCSNQLEPSYVPGLSKQGCGLVLLAAWQTVRLRRHCNHTAGS